MVLEDIGYTIFAELLGMSQYPGSPFTGNITKDLILFLFVPSVFIILFIYRILGSLFSNLQGRMRLLVGTALYLFIVASGYYAAFALIAGPYFIVLIFILGVIYFVFGHFGVRRGHTMPGAALTNEGAIHDLPEKIRTMLGVPELDPGERAILERQLGELEKRRDAIMRHDVQGRGTETLDKVNAQIFAIENRLGRK
jgi:hypothetical protein